MKTGTKLAIGALLLALACVALWSNQVQKVDIPENRTLFVVGFLSAAALGVAAFVKGTSWLGAIPAVFAILIGGFVPFSISISAQEVAAHGIEVGQTMPQFAALNDKGELFDSASLQGHPVLIKFFRAHW